MPNQPNSSTEHATQQSQIALSFARDEWELIVTLPRRVLLAASASRPESTHHSVAEGLAGIEAIASGIGSRSALVREVVTSIFAESGHHGPDEPTEGEMGILQTLAACRYASEVLTHRCTNEDAAAYRDWLERIAAAVTGANREVGTAVSTGRGALAENRFLYALGGVLRP